MRFTTGLRRAVVLGLVLIALGGVSNAQPSAAPDPRQMVEQMVNAYIQRTGTHGVAVSLYYGGRGYLLSFGDDGRFPANPVTPDLIFGIGSVIKVFTATMLAYQTIGEDGAAPLKHIDDCVCDYLAPQVRMIRRLARIENRQE